MGTGTQELTTTLQKVASAGRPVDLMCASPMFFGSTSSASGTDLSVWPANLPYPTTGNKDLYAKVETGTATMYRTES